MKTKIIIHASDTPAEMDIGAAEIDRWHKARGLNYVIPGLPARTVGT